MTSQFPRISRLVLAVLAAGHLSAALAEWAQGQIRRIDPENKKVTIKHGEIKSIDMPPMSMVFALKDPSMLEGINPNDLVEFQATEEGGKYIVTAIRKQAP